MILDYLLTLMHLHHLAIAPNTVHKTHFWTLTADGIFTELASAPVCNQHTQYTYIQYTHHILLTVTSITPNPPVYTSVIYIKPLLPDTLYRYVKHVLLFTHCSVWSTSGHTEFSLAGRRRTCLLLDLLFFWSHWWTSSTAVTIFNRLSNSLGVDVWH